MNLPERTGVFLSTGRRSDRMGKGGFLFTRFWNRFSTVPEPKKDMGNRLFFAAMLALLCLGCAAKDTEEQGKRHGMGLGTAVGAGALAAGGDPCAGMALLVKGR